MTETGDPPVVDTDVTMLGYTGSNSVTSGTSLTLTLPSGIQAGDAVYIATHLRSTLTVPAGWSLVDDVSVVPGYTMTVSLLKKDTVTVADSGAQASITWAISNFGYALAFALRPTSGVVNETVDFYTASNVTEGVNIPVAAQSSIRSTSAQIVFSATLLQTSSNWTFNAETGYTRFFSAGASQRLFGMYKHNMAQGAAGVSVMDATATESGYGGNYVITMAVMARTSMVLEEVVENSGIDEAFSGAGSTYSGTLTDASQVIDANFALPPTATMFEDAITDTAGLASAFIELYPLLQSMTQGVSVGSDPLEFLFSRGVTAVDTAMLSPVTVQDQGGTIAETLGLAPIANPDARFRLQLTQAYRIADQIRRGSSASLQDTAVLAVTLQSGIAIKVAQALGITPIDDPQTVYKLTLAETIALQDLLRRFLSGDVLEDVGIQSVTLPKFYNIGNLAEGVTVGDGVANNLLVRAIASDEVNLDDIDILQLLYDPELVENVELTAAYLSPGDTFATWVVNTRNQAVSEYSNYKFNSFAKMGHKYIGANSDGLYELNGDDDDGTSVIADIKSGLMAFGGSRFTAFKAAYLGIRGTRGAGEFILRLEAGDGKTYDYSVVSKDMETTRVQLGKGLRARYFSFQLISTGQDFDLDSIEFMPLVAKRRV